MQARGIFLTVLSAVLYGLNPLFSKTINVGGCNSLTQTFARLAAGIVIFFILLVCSGSGSRFFFFLFSSFSINQFLSLGFKMFSISRQLFRPGNNLRRRLNTTGTNR